MLLHSAFTPDQSMTGAPKHDSPLQIVRFCTSKETKYPRKRGISTRYQAPNTLPLIFFLEYENSREYKKSVGNPKPLLVPAPVTKFQFLSQASKQCKFAKLQRKAFLNVEHRAGTSDPGFDSNDNLSEPRSNHNGATIRVGRAEGPSKQAFGVQIQQTVSESTQKDTLGDFQKKTGIIKYKLYHYSSGSDPPGSAD